MVVVGLGGVGLSVVQGDADEYASTEHAVVTAAAIGPRATCRILPGLGHLLHHQDPDGLTALVAAFLDDRFLDDHG